MKHYYVYILTNYEKTTFYVGVTNNLSKRIQEHRQAFNPKAFTARYNVYYLVYFETFMDVLIAISREKEIKGWSRQKKLNLIHSENPNMTFIDIDGQN